MRVPRILGVMVASVALAMTGIAGATAAQADNGHHHYRNHQRHGYQHHKKFRHHRKSRQHSYRHFRY